MSWQHLNQPQGWIDVISLSLYTVIEHSVMVAARGCPSSTCISPVWLERGKLSLPLSQADGSGVLLPPRFRPGGCTLGFPNFYSEVYAQVSDVLVSSWLVWKLVLYAARSVSKLRSRSWQHLHQPCGAGKVFYLSVSL